MIMDRYLFGLDFCKLNKIFKWHKNCIGRLKYFSNLLSDVAEFPETIKSTLFNPGEIHVIPATIQDKSTMNNLSTQQTGIKT